MFLVALGLAGGDQASGLVSDADGGVDFLDVLAALGRGAVELDVKIFRINFDLGFFDFWEDSHSSGGGVDAALGFGDWNALDSMNPSFIFEERISLFAPDFNDVVVNGSDF